MDKVALITGGARGIGRAIVENLRRDHQIAFTWLATEPSAELKQCSTLSVQSDLRENGEPARVIQKVISRFGRLDAIVNNAGLVRSTPKDTFVAEDHTAILNLNLLAPAALLAAALPHLNTGASIVSISSMNATCPLGTQLRTAPAKPRSICGPAQWPKNWALRA